MVPPGSIMAFGGPTENIPGGWLLCDGKPASSTLHPRLFAAIGTAWGAGVNDGDINTDFNLPDLRGRFPRGVSGISNLDPDASTRIATALGGNTGNNVGSAQSNEVKAHNHSVNINGTTQLDGQHTHDIERDDGFALRWGDGGGSSNDRIDSADSDGADSHRVKAKSAGGHRHSFNVFGSSASRGGGESRPENVYVNYIIKL